MKSLIWFDVVFVLGLLLIAGGLALWSAPIALVVTGVELVIIAVFGALRARPQSTSPSAPLTDGTPDSAAS